jgi:hypothetical protein
MASAKVTSQRLDLRAWLGEKGAGPEVKDELMRHSSIGMTMDGYGRGVSEANRVRMRSLSVIFCSDSA